MTETGKEETTMETKSLGPVEVKSEDSGEVQAVFSKFNVRDLDGDVTLKSAFTQGTQVKISSFNHGSWEGGNLPVGVGHIDVEDDRAVLKGRFFMSTNAGRETFETVKGLGDLGEWSYGFVVTDQEMGDFEGKTSRFIKKVNVFEVSPVLKGAGIGTGTLAVKSQGNSTLAGEAETVLAALESLTARASDVLASRRIKGKGLGEESSELLEKIAGQLKAINELLVNPEAPSEDEDNSELVHEYLRWIASQHNLAA